MSVLDHLAVDEFATCHTVGRRASHVHWQVDIIVKPSVRLEAASLHNEENDCNNIAKYSKSKKSPHLQVMSNSHSIPVKLRQIT